MRVYKYVTGVNQIYDENDNLVCSFDCSDFLDDFMDDERHGKMFAKAATFFPAMLEQLKNAVALWGSRCTDQSQEIWLELTNRIIEEAEES